MREQLIKAIDYAIDTDNKIYFNEKKIVKGYWGHGQYVFLEQEHFILVINTFWTG